MQSPKPAGRNTFAELGELTRTYFPDGPLRDLITDGIIGGVAGTQPGATRDFEAAVSVWPVHDNAAIRPLKDLYGAAGNEPGRKRLEDLAAKKR